MYAYHYNYQSNTYQNTGINDTNYFNTNYNNTNYDNCYDCCRECDIINKYKEKYSTTLNISSIIDKTVYFTLKNNYKCVFHGENKVKPHQFILYHINNKNINILLESFNDLYNL